MWLLGLVSAEAPLPVLPTLVPCAGSRLCAVLCCVRCAHHHLATSPSPPLQIAAALGASGLAVGYIARLASQAVAEMEAEEQNEGNDSKPRR